MTHREKHESEYERRERKESQKIVRLLVAFILLVLCGRALIALFGK